VEKMSDTKGAASLLPTLLGLREARDLAVQQGKEAAGEHKEKWAVVAMELEVAIWALKRRIESLMGLNKLVI